MLKISLRDEGTKLRFDVDGEFLMLTAADTPLNRQLIKEIDKGEYIDSYTFKDRFGRVLGVESLSTGCKAALLVANTDLNVDLQECGTNAVSAIIRNCTDGSITLIDTGLCITLEGNPGSTPIDVAIDGYHVKDLDTLNQYLMYMVDLDSEEYNAERIE